MIYSMNKKYPEIKVERENIYYAKLLLEDYAGINGELSAITEYSYQHFDKFKENEILAKSLSRIAMVEMKHLEILGKLIKLLGLNPEYKYYDECENIYKYWNSDSLNYTSNIKEMLYNDIRIEKIAIANYEYHISLINDKYIKEILYRIIEDELVHIDCFKMLISCENN